MILGHGIDKKRNEEAFRARGAPEKMAQGYMSRYNGIVAAGMADASGPRNVQPPRI